MPTTQARHQRHQGGTKRRRTKRRIFVLRLFVRCTIPH
jgi:hypothetical protein